MTMTETNEMTQKKMTPTPPPPYPPTPLLRHNCALTKMETWQVLPGSRRTRVSFSSELQTTV